MRKPRGGHVPPHCSVSVRCASFFRKPGNLRIPKVFGCYQEPKFSQKNCLPLFSLYPQMGTTVDSSFGYVLALNPYGTRAKKVTIKALNSAAAKPPRKGRGRASDPVMLDHDSRLYTKSIRSSHSCIPNRQSRTVGSLRDFS